MVVVPSHHGFQYFSLLKWSNDLDDLGYPYDLGKQRKPYLRHENICFENVWDIKKTDQSSKAHQVKQAETSDQNTIRCDEVPNDAQF